MKSRSRARFDAIMIVSLWNLTDLSNFKAIGKVLTRISQFQDFTRSYGKTSVRLLNTGPGWGWWGCGSGHGVVLRHFTALHKLHYQMIHFQKIQAIMRYSTSCILWGNKINPNHNGCYFKQRSVKRYITHKFPAHVIYILMTNYSM